MRISGQQLKDSNFLGSYQNLNEHTPPMNFLYLFGKYIESKDLGYDFRGRGSESIYDAEDLELDHTEQMHIYIAANTEYDDASEIESYKKLVKKFANLIAPELNGRSYMILDVSEFAEIYDIVTEQLELSVDQFAFVFRHDNIFLVTDQGNRDLIRIKLIKE